MFLDFYPVNLSRQKDTNDFLRKLQNLAKLPDDAILCTIDLVVLYRNTPNDEGLLLLNKMLDKQRKSYFRNNISTDLSAKETVISTSTFCRDTHTIAIP